MLYRQNISVVAAEESNDFDSGVRYTPALRRVGGGGIPKPKWYNADEKEEGRNKKTERNRGKGKERKEEKEKRQRKGRMRDRKEGEGEDGKTKKKRVCQGLSPYTLVTHSVKMWQSVQPVRVIITGGTYICVEAQGLLLRRGSKPQEVLRRMCSMLHVSIPTVFILYIRDGEPMARDTIFWARQLSK
ncbi:hypothetical protein TNCV_1156651 [Trichonephila clavipes]|nr:hypothetical protein TNCV_1156651 [Trichonephila clavipes]